MPKLGNIPTGTDFVFAKDVTPSEVFEILPSEVSRYRVVQCHNMTSESLHQRAILDVAKNMVFQEHPIYKDLYAEEIIIIR